ncbi:hypothetical protein [Natranaeroarchaeum sulfidigenes]|uniref:DUF8168 domain-containing protein n=1 Tax=Natranaeroarchaeum sulfidigenes TaxID=2784880 RepID=A0A897MR56_9EURY|nr:hypothetical protein [Natranaeroarchaeum sulfidigenes]QSG02902.1 Uncharacterized protein AArcS_1692 [Natranaeroarchaeum sulfidigenes]
MTDSTGAAGAGRDSVDGEGETDVAPMLAVYRHDVHKLFGRSHASARDRVHGVRVNETVPHGADRDAALLSRPRGDPEQTLDAYASPPRVSFLTGEVVMTGGLRAGGRDAAVRKLVRIEDAEAMHEAWLSADVPALVNESVYYPYTSLKYHTLLAAALLDNYRAGFAFDELFLVVEETDGSATPHRTVLSTPDIRLEVTAEPGDRPAARLGETPTRCFADVWARLPEYPFDVSVSRRWGVLDAQLRRIRSWSAALQFVAEYCHRFDPAGDAGRGGEHGGER